MEKKGIAYSTIFRCNISADGMTAEEAAEKLAKLLSEHLNSCYEKKIAPFYVNIYEFEKFGKYCAEKGFPKKLCDINLGSIILRFYDLTK